MIDIEWKKTLGTYLRIIMTNLPLLAVGYLIVNSYPPQNWWSLIVTCCIILSAAILINFIAFMGKREKQDFNLIMESLGLSGLLPQKRIM